MDPDFIIRLLQGKHSMSKKNENETKQNKVKKKGTRPVVFMVVCSVLFMAFVTVGTYFYYSNVVEKSEALLKKTGSSDYDSHYVLICDNTEMWDDVYSFAKDKGNENKILVDRISSRLGDDYTKEDLMKIAIESGVDGILLEAENTDEYRKLIDDAEAKGICVVTLMNDCVSSKRKSLVQSSAYNLGKIYGEQFVSEKRREDKKVFVVMDTNSKNLTQNIVYSGIQDTLKANGFADIEVYPLSIDSRDSFATEEDIRKVFMSEGTDADAIICLDEISTAGFYQALIDYNKVGDIRLIGYYNSEQILKGIQQGVIEATVAIDARELAEYGVEAIKEYREFGYVSDYFSVGSQLINKDNIDDVIEPDNK